MKKKLIIFILAMVLLLGVAGGTYAYFTTGTVTHNVITSGRVKVELVELSAMDGTAFENIVNAMPGDSYDKIVLAKNAGDSDAWIRVRFAKSALDAAGKALDAELITFDVDCAGWQEKDGWFYYDAPLRPGETTKPIAGKVILPRGLGNTWQKATFVIDVTAQAVQVANNGASVLEAAGWPETRKGDS